MSRSRVISSIAGLVAILPLGSAAIAADRIPPARPPNEDIVQWKPLDKSMAALVKDGYRLISAQVAPNIMLFLLQDSAGHVASCTESHTVVGSPPGPLGNPDTRHVKGAIACEQLVEPFVPPAQ